MGGWSDDVRAETRRAVRDLDAVLLGELSLKHAGGAYGLISAADALADRLRVVDRTTGVAGEFADVDALLRAGWVVD